MQILGCYIGKIAISNNLSILNVLLVESLNFNLLSVAQLCDLRFKCIFGVDDVEIISVDGSNLIFKGFRYENLYLVDFSAREAQFRGGNLIGEIDRLSFWEGKSIEVSPP